VPVIRKDRVVRDVSFEPEPAEPSIGEVEVYLLEETALGPKDEAIADDQHADHQLGADRGTHDLAVERPKVRL
jgi:hypothetical protein